MRERLQATLMLCISRFIRTPSRIIHLEAKREQGREGLPLR